MTLLRAKAFFDTMRSGILGPSLSTEEVTGCEAIMGAFQGQPRAFVAYALATAFLETAGTMQPIKEFGGYKYFMSRYDKTGANPALAKRLGNTEPGDGAKYAGRGYVQLTGRANYQRAERELDAPFVTSPDLALARDYAAAVMRRGMTEGWFTGKKLADYFGSGREDPVGARRIINGQDRASDVARYYRQFAAALAAGGWTP